MVVDQVKKIRCCEMTASGRFRQFVTAREFFTAATCYAALNGRVRPRAAVRTLGLMQC